MKSAKKTGTKRKRSARAPRRAPPQLMEEILVMEILRGCPSGPSCGSGPCARPGEPPSPTPSSSGHTSGVRPPSGSRTHASSSAPRPWTMGGRPSSPTTSSSTNGSCNDVVTFLDDFCRPFNILRYLTHCDGLLLALTNTGLYLFNPATRDAITLPDSHRNDLRALGRPKCYRAGLGLDPRTGRYKVVQAFYRSVVDPDTGTGTDMGMEVFTVGGGGGGWREIAGDPPYPARRVQTALAASGFMFWRLAEPLEQEPWGILDLSLDDEEFDVTGLPDDVNPEDEFFLDVLHGRDLCLTACNSSQTILNIWVLPIADEGLCTMWDWRYAIEFTAGLCHTMALPPFSSNGIILWRADTVCCYELATDEVKVVRELRDMRNQRPREWGSLFNFSTVMPFTESLVQITSRSHQGSSWNPWIKLLML
ncbi:hypothetical protein C2845_PM12G00790 [Panicum miliaceum]|uniref:F-box associated beta-propeller type 3 domain-containing protein n=1 Tax=Panicum miliaceum TaxID=4540 RepID=A0A3L6QE42_PANMI|nr:hypothetical protein C2845_PM12G00790 [Panicum miliaceum]